MIGGRVMEIGGGPMGDGGRPDQRPVDQRSDRSNLRRNERGILLSDSATAVRITVKNSQCARGPTLALMLAVSAGSVCAQGIVHTVPPQPLYYGGLPSSQGIDVNNDGTTDFNLTTSGFGAYLNPLNNNSLLVIPEAPPDIGALIVPLPVGTTISSSSSASPILWYDRSAPYAINALIVACADIGCIGYFQGNTDAYAGVRLDVGGSLYYGWIHIQNGGLNFGQITDWAYESSSPTPIFAGAVPEPGNVWLLSLGGIVAVVLRFRGRKAQA